MVDLIQEIKSKLDIVDLISEYVELKKSGNVYIGHCPFHEDLEPSFVVYPDTQSFYCFGCRAGSNSSITKGSDLISFYAAIKNIALSDAIKELAVRLNISYEKDNSYFQNNLELSRKFYIDLYSSDNALNYLYNRGLDDDDITKWRIGYCSDGFLSGRIIFPILDVGSRTVGFVGRSILDETPKYINSKNNEYFQKHKILYGINYAISSIKRMDKVYVVEGPMDCIKMHKIGLDNTVALLGKEISNEQISYLLSLTDNIVFVLDSDKAGIEAMLSSCRKVLKYDKMPSFCILRGNKDPDEFISSNENARKYIEDNTTDYCLFVLNKYQDEYMKRIYEAKKEFLAKCNSFLEGISDGDVKEFLKSYIYGTLNNSIENKAV